MNVPANTFFSSALQADEETLALFHLDGSLEDAAKRSPALRLAGKASFDTSNLSWMEERKGAALRVKDIGDKGTAKIVVPRAELVSEVTLQAMIYLNAFKAYNRTNVKILSLTEDWNSFVELNENMYEGAMIKGGSEFSLTQTTVTNALKPANWNHISITIDKEGYTAKVNGKTIGTKKSGELANWGKQPATLEIGNFDGYIDEVAVICKTNSAVGRPAAAQAGTGSGNEAGRKPAR